MHVHIHLYFYAVHIYVAWTPPLPTSTITNIITALIHITTAGTASISTPLDFDETPAAYIPKVHQQSGIPI
jgi:hypothetical protein